MVCLGEFRVGKIPCIGDGLQKSHGRCDDDGMDWGEEWLTIFMEARVRNISGAMVE